MNLSIVITLVIIHVQVELTIGEIDIGYTIRFHFFLIDRR